ncbi:MAG: hypothetical protein ICV53_22595 [Flavisolibacter sp.]|nr:hypothetical protein [Flavisolibacter sp.]
MKQQVKAEQEGCISHFGLPDLTPTLSKRRGPPAAQTLLFRVGVYALAFCLSKACVQLPSPWQRDRRVRW